MKKKLLSLILVTTMLFVLAGCSSKENATADIENTQQEEVETASEDSVDEAASEAPQADENVDAAEEQENTDTSESEEEMNIEAAENTEEQSSEGYTYTDMEETMYATQTVNVRDLPSTDGNKVGSLNTGDEIQVTGKCNETSWYRFELSGSIVYVSDKYVCTEKVEASAASTSTSSSGGITKEKAIELISKCCTPPRTLTGRYYGPNNYGDYTFEVVPGYWVDTYNGYLYKGHFGGMMDWVPNPEMPDGFYYPPRDDPSFDPTWMPSTEEPQYSEALKY